MNELEQTGGGDDLRRVARMADLLTAAAQRVLEAEAALAKASADLRKIEEEDSPDLLEEVGLKEVMLEDGRKITLTPEIQCGISDERRPRAHAWLRDNNYGGIIKNVVILEFGVGEDALKQETVKHLATDLHLVPIEKESVHAATLKSFIKEQRAKGASPPEELFAIRPYNKVKVKAAKA